MMTIVKRAHSLPLAASIAAVALAGCSGVGMTEGVVIDGTGYSVEEVQEASQQLSVVSPEPVDTAGAIYQAGLAPLLSGWFEGTSYEITDSEIRSELSDAGLEDEAGDLTVEAVKFQRYAALTGDQAAMSSEELAPVLAELQSLTEDDIGALPVEVNPRFGSWGPAGQGIVPEVPEWIVQPES